MTWSTTSKRGAPTSPLRFELEDGAYGLDATLLDRSGRAVTTTLELEVDVFEGEETFVDIDFPLDSLR